MSDKSLIFSLFSKFLDNSRDAQEEETETEAVPQPVNQKAPRDLRVEMVEDWNETERKRIRDQEEGWAGQTGPEEHIGEPGEAEEYRDAGLELTVSPDRMSVSVMALEPTGGGADISRTQVYEKLYQNGVIYGINEEKIDSIVAGKQYRQLFNVAEGTPPVNGNDGRIKDYFPREAQLKYASKENGGIDFKSMNLIHNVNRGELVCELTMPTEPQEGTDVFGQPVRGKNGTMPPIPQGRNVVYSPERDKLLTACEGNLTFRNGRFQVENVFSVPGNVDNSVGNIDFTGSVVIYGDVFEGFTVKAKGDIAVNGIVEGAFLKAGGSILLHKGMRGMKTGILEAGVDITAKFLEDCTIFAQNDIRAEYIINSDVSCGHDMTLIGKRGAFIGGSCAVYNFMNVKAVGSASHTATTVTLGATPQLMEEVESITRELLLTGRRQAQADQNIRYLNGKQTAGTITPRQEERLSKLKLEVPVYTLKEKRLKQRAAELSRQLREVGRARLTAGEVHPGTVICIGESRLSIVKREESCAFYYLDGEIKKGIR